MTRRSDNETNKHDPREREAALRLLRDAIRQGRESPIVGEADAAYFAALRERVGRPAVARRDVD
jgi:hypothetical protein